MSRVPLAHNALAQGALADLSVAADWLNEAELTMSRLRAERDVAIIRARAAGATVAAIMEFGSITRATVYKALG